MDSKEQRERGKSSQLLRGETKTIARGTWQHGKEAQAERGDKPEPRHIV